MSRLGLFVAALAIIAMPSSAAEAQPATAGTAIPSTTKSPPTVERVREKLPLEAFAQLDFVEDAKLSPDGTHIAGLFGIDGKKTLAILKISNIHENPVRLPFPDRSEIGDVRWINDQFIVATLYRIDKNNGKDVYVGRLISVDCGAGTLRILLPEVRSLSPAELLWSASDKSNEILVQARQSDFTGTTFNGGIALENEYFWPTVYRINLGTGRTTKVRDGEFGIGRWYADKEGTLRLGEGHDDSKLEDLLLYRPEGVAAFKRTQRASIKKHESLIAPFLFLPGGDHALAVGKDAKDNAIIGEYDMSSVSLARTLYTAEYGNLDPILSADHSTLLGVNTSSRRGTFWFDSKLANIQLALENSIPTGFVKILAMSADTTKMLVKNFGGDAPGAIYFMDTNEGALHRFAWINARIGSQHLAETSMIRYVARDGVSIEAKLTMPPGLPPKNLPMIMLPHGGPWAHDTMVYDYWPQFLASRGYVVLQPNFRGSDGYGDEFERKGEGQMGLAMQDDLSDGVNWAVKSGQVDPKRVCILGGSYGGYAAMWGIIKDPSFYRCAVSIAGVSSLTREVNAFGRYLFGKTYQFEWNRMSSNFESISPINFVDKVKSPLLLIHGKQDVTVDISQSQRMFEKMKSAGKSVEYVVLPLADHHYQRQADRVTLLSSIETFLNKYNPPD